MAIVYPGAWYRQLPNKSTTLLGPRIINVHTMVWDLHSCEDYFARPGNPYSHFGTGPNGEVYQWQDLTYRAASDLDGNTFTISIENADKGPGYPQWSGSDVPRFTSAQAEAIAQLIAWLCARFGIPPYEVPDSLPERRGPGKHRDGINPWRVPEGVLYSKSYGKVCPGDRRIDQFHNEIMPRVRVLLAPPPPSERPHKTMDLCFKPDGSGRVDAVVIGPAPNQNVYHYYAESVDALFDAPSENIAGFAKDVTCTWSGESFVVWCHGGNDKIWMQVWKPGVGWLKNWVEAPEGNLVAG